MFKVKNLTMNSKQPIYIPKSFAWFLSSSNDKSSSAILLSHGDRTNCFVIGEFQKHHEFVRTWNAETFAKERLVRTFRQQSLKIRKQIRRTEKAFLFRHVQGNRRIARSNILGIIKESKASPILQKIPRQNIVVVHASATDFRQIIHALPARLR